MLKSHTLQLEQSELREQINGYLNQETELTTENRADLDTLTKRGIALELELRASLVSESSSAETRTWKDDGEGREIRQMLSAVSIHDYMFAAVAGKGIEGRAAELNAALEVPIIGGSGGVAIPWAALEVRTEHRAFTDTGDLGGGTGQRPVLERLFGPGIMDTLGVRLDAVPYGLAQWPLITSGTTLAMKAEGSAADAAVAAGFSTETLKPKRLTGRFEYTHEQAAEVANLEEYLRKDLVDDAKSQMEKLTITGNEANSTHEPSGFLEKLTAQTNPSTTTTYGQYAGAHAVAVDGIHASMETEVSSVIGVASYRHSATVINTGSGESASEAMKRRSMTCMASSYIPVPAGANLNQNGNIFHLHGPNGGAMRGDSVAAIWPTLEIIRDIYTQASQGVVLTTVMLWDLEAAFRLAAYDRLTFRHN